MSHMPELALQCALGPRTTALLIWLLTVVVLVFISFLPFLRFVTTPLEDGKVVEASEVVTLRLTTFFTPTFTGTPSSLGLIATSSCSTAYFAAAASGLLLLGNSLAAFSGVLTSCTVTFLLHLSASASAKRTKP